MFYAAVAPLLAFYALFAAVIYPAAPALHLDAAGLLSAVPTGLQGLVKVRLSSKGTVHAGICTEGRMLVLASVHVLSYSRSQPSSTMHACSTPPPGCFQLDLLTVLLLCGAVGQRRHQRALLVRGITLVRFKHACTHVCL